MTIFAHPEQLQLFLRLLAAHVLEHSIIQMCYRRQRSTKCQATIVLYVQVSAFRKQPVGQTGPETREYLCASSWNVTRGADASMC